jgi:hypothetical protein
MKRINFYTGSLTCSLPFLRFALALFFVLTPYLCSSALAQEVCKTGCTSNDIQIKEAYFVTMDTGGLFNKRLTPEFTCNAGAIVEVRLALELTTKTQRNGVYIFANLKNEQGTIVTLQERNTDNVVIRSFNGSVSECFSKSLSTTAPTTKVVFSQPILWRCGTTINLADVFIGWGTGNADFCGGSPEPKCPATPSKCSSLTGNQYVPVVTYLCSTATFSNTTLTQVKCSAQDAQFSTEFTAAPNTRVASVQWQLSEPNSTAWTDIQVLNTNYNTVNTILSLPLTLPAGSGKTTLNIISVAGLNGFKYRAKVRSISDSGQECTGYSQEATLTVNDKPSVAAITPPAALCAGGSLNPTAPAVTTNGSAVTAQGWQIETGVGSGTYQALEVPYAVTYADNGKKIRYTATNGCGTTNNTGVTLTVNEAPSAIETEFLAPTDCMEPTVQMKVKNPSVGTYTLNQSGKETKTFVYEGSGNVIFSGFTLGVGYELDFSNGAGCASSTLVCGNGNIKATSTSALQSIEKPLSDDQLTAYPIPFSQNVTLEFKAERTGKYEINLYDMKGQLIRQLKAGNARAGEITRIEVDGRQMAEGMYLARMVSGAGSKTVKLLKKN